LPTLTITPGEPGNPPIRTYRWQRTATYRTGLMQSQQEEYEQAMVLTFFDWGHSPHGNFTLKEGHALQEGFQFMPKDPIWTVVWKSKFWPKISTFLWLLIQNKILTWDNLQKRGFIGPSICHLCNQHEENMEHLLNNCTINVVIWDHATQLLRRTHRDQGSIINTIRNWGT
jgi:hypothetical protein